MSTQRLEHDEIKALKFAGHRQLARWSRKLRLDPHQHATRRALIRAVQKLDDDAYADGVELRAPEPG